MTRKIFQENISKESEIAAIRIFNAPRELVWKVWTEQEHIINWWGPNGFITTIHKMEVKPGGIWEFIMHGPDGVDYKNKNVFIDVIKPELLIYDHVNAPKHHVTVTFQDMNGKTKLSMQMLFNSEEERIQTIKKFDAVEGLKQTLGRLQKYLTKF